tara:strand:+ start:1629 stop:3482 length:1854 start_codon:yes stop_codon:yes gene_type:complete
MNSFRKGDYPAAVKAAEEALEVRPHDQALLAVASLAALNLGDQGRAIAFLRAHHRLNPDDLAVRANLATALAEKGCKDEALELAAGSDHHALARLEGFLRQEQGDATGAIAAYRRALLAQAGDAHSWHNLGNLLATAGNLADAFDSFERAIRLKPDEVGFYVSFVSVLAKEERHSRRLELTRSGLERMPDEPEMLTEHGLALIANERQEEAIAFFEKAIESLPEDGRAKIHAAHIELAIVLENLNRVDDLRHLVDRCCATGIDDAELAFLQAWLARREGDIETAWRHAIAIPETINPIRTAQLLADLADRRGDSERAFSEFTRMNQAALSENGSIAPKPSYRKQLDSDRIFWTKERLLALSQEPVADGNLDPVFLVGFPRSGTTLLDTMLMAIPSLLIMEERPVLMQATANLDRSDLASLDQTAVRALRKRYFQLAAEKEGTLEGRRIVDKHPLQMTKIPLIHRIFPSAQIILMERHPYDAVLSCFIANFKLNHAMRSFTTLEEAALTYDSVFSTWEESISCLPVNVFKVRYESLVLDREKELRRLINWLRVDWNDDLMRHEKVARGRGRIKTASYAQVTEPIYNRAVYRWTRYREMLEEVAPTLRPWAERQGYETN